MSDARDSRSLARRPLQRRDAAENRARLLDAAREVFAGHGPDAPLDEIARAAGVSRTTLHRNFTTREELAAAVYEDNVWLHEQQAQSLIGRADGIVTLYDHVLLSAVRHRGFTRILRGADTQWFSDLSERVVATFTLLLDDGIAAGIVRPGITIADIMITFQMADNVVVDQPVTSLQDSFDRAARLLRSALFDLSHVRAQSPAGSAGDH